MAELANGSKSIFKRADSHPGSANRFMVQQAKGIAWFLSPMDMGELAPLGMPRGGRRMQRLQAGVRQLFR